MKLNRFDDQRLSGEEMRELLGETPGVDSETEPGGTASGGRHILFVARGGGELDLLRARLHAHGAAVTFVRNPFAALDQLRKAWFEGIVTDLDLWARGGALLFERVSRLEPSLPVLCVATRPAEGAEALIRGLRGVPGCRLLFRPVRASQLEAAVEAFLAPRAVEGETPPPLPPEVASRSSPGPVDSVVEGSVARDPVQEGPASESAIPLEAELAWLRFLHAGARVAREASSVKLAAEGILELALEHLRPAAAVAVRTLPGPVRVLALARGPEDAARCVSGAVPSADSPRKVPEETGIRAEATVSVRGETWSFRFEELPGETAPGVPDFLEDVARLFDRFA